MSGRTVTLNKFACDITIAQEIVIQLIRCGGKAILDIGRVSMVQIPVLFFMTCDTSKPNVQS